MFTINSITKEFSHGKVVTKVLKGISLEVQDGEFIAIMGKSGAGKSTLLYVMSLLDTPTAGTIAYRNQVVNDLSEKEMTAFRLHNFGYVFQDYALVPELTAVENVMVPLLMQGVQKEEAQKQAIAILNRIDLGHRVGNLPSELSGGEQQRVAIARSIVHNPAVLFADEPTASLDTASSESVLALFEKLNSEGQTIVMVTHEPEYTKNCDRIIYIEDGMISREEKKA